MRRRQEAIRVLIAEGDPARRERLRAIVTAEPALALVGLTTPGPDTVRLAVERLADVVLLGPIAEESLSLGELLRAYRSAAVIVVTARGTEIERSAAREAGATAVCSPDIAVPSLVDLIARCAVGEIGIDDVPGLAASILTAPGTPAPTRAMAARRGRRMLGRWQPAGKRAPSAHVDGLVDPKTLLAARATRAAAPPARRGVLVVTDDQFVYESVRAVLMSAPNLALIGWVAPEAATQRLARRPSPDVVVVGPIASGLSNLPVATQIRRHEPRPAVLLLTVEPTDDELFAAIRAGVAAYYPVGVDGGTLVSALSRCSAGEFVINEQLLSQSAEPEPGSMTAREHRMLVMVSEGMTDAEIRRALGIGIWSMRREMSGVMRKTGGKDRATMIASARRRGYLDPDPSADASPPRRPYPTLLEPEAIDLDTMERLR